WCSEGRSGRRLVATSMAESDTETASKAAAADAAGPDTAVKDAPPQEPQAKGAAPEPFPKAPSVPPVQAASSMTSAKVPAPPSASVPAAPPAKVPSSPPAAAAEQQAAAKRISMFPGAERAS